MKKFKAKKKKKFLKLTLFFLIVYIVLNLMINILFSIKVENKFLISTLLNSSNNYLSENSLINDIAIFFKNIKPVDLLNDKINVVEENKDLTYYIDDPNPVDIKNPKVYIYNTHQLEGYDLDNNDYDIIPNVQMASYLLKDKLNNYGIPTIVETGNISDLLNINGWNYNYSYEASRYYLKNALNKYSDLELIIDLHRDSIAHDKSTYELDNKKYAKLLFVIGTDYLGYESNLELANKLNDLIEIPISRGVLEKGGKGVNGIYNQDLNKNIILIEVGGNENTLDEIINTIDALSLAIKKYMGE